LSNNWRRFYVLSINASKPFFEKYLDECPHAKIFEMLLIELDIFLYLLLKLFNYVQLFMFLDFVSQVVIMYTSSATQIVLLKWMIKEMGLKPSIYNLRLGCNIWWLNMVSSRNIGIWTFKEGITWVTPHERIYFFIHCLVEMSKYIHSYFLFQVQVQTICIDSCPKHTMKNVFEVFIGCAPQFVFACCICHFLQMANANLQ